MNDLFGVSIDIVFMKDDMIQFLLVSNSGKSRVFFHIVGGQHSLLILRAVLE